LKKLLIVKFPLESSWGGEEEIHLLLAKEMRSCGYKIALITSCPYLHERFLKEGFCSKKLWNFPDPVSIKALLFFSLTSILFFITGLIFLPYYRIKGYKNILFLRFGEKILWTGLARIFGMKVFWGEHCGFGKWIYKNPLLFLWKLMSNFSIFIVPSLEMKKQVLDLLPNAKVNILPNALDSNEQKNCSKNIATKSQKITIGYAGRLSCEKGLLTLTDIANEIIKENKNVHFTLAGSGDMRDRIEEKVKEYNIANNFHLLGFLDKEKLKKFFCNIDIFILLSDFETFGIVLLEAMNAEKPIIATRTGAIPEIVIDNQNGILVSKNSKYEIISAVKNLIKNQNLRISLGKAGKKLFLSKFTKEKFLNNAKKIFFND